MVSAMSYIGEQLVVQKKLGPLEPDRRYHYLGRFGEMAKSVLVNFDDKPGAYLTILKATEFESALDLNLITTAPEQEKLPPWLKRYASFDLPTLDKQRPTAKRSLASIVDKHLFQITPIVDQTKELFAYEDPERELNRAARNCSPKLNESRARLQVLTYLAFGRNKWALMPAYCNVGHPKDMGCPPGQPGEGSGALDVKAERRRTREAMRKVSCDGFEQFAKLGVFMNEIWTKTLTKMLGCKVQTLANGTKVFYHPAGAPFPSFWQFYRAVIRRFGLATVQLKLYGAARVRHKRATSKGKFSEVVANLVERIEGDAYYVKEVPKGPANGEPMPPLCVVRLRCRTSGMRVFVKECG